MGRGGWEPLGREMVTLQELVGLGLQDSPGTSAPLLRLSWLLLLVARWVVLQQDEDGDTDRDLKKASSSGLWNKLSTHIPEPPPLHRVLGFISLA